MKFRCRLTLEVWELVKFRCNELKNLGRNFRLKLGIDRDKGGSEDQLLVKHFKMSSLRL
jgi:hypothetical protein